MRSMPWAALAAALTLSGCSLFSGWIGGSDSALNSTPGGPAHPSTKAEIRAEDLKARVKALAGDYFEGRGPGTAKGELAAAWIADEMKRLGLKPGNGASYFQDVPAVTITLDPAQSSFEIVGPRNNVLKPAFADEVVYWTRHAAGPDETVKNSPLVFMGYGVSAPEEKWDDYAGVDVKGKTLVVMINDPGFITRDEKLFKGRAMTYYGRWTYKYEEAARRGAAAVLIVHETEPAAYGWQVVRNSNTGAKSYLDSPNQDMDRVALEGWITTDVARKLFASAGLNYDKLRIAANQRGFKPVPMRGLTLNATMHSMIGKMMTRNVVGVIEGTKHPDQYFLYTGHWDHLGVKPDAPGTDKIHNGAIDNATGIAGIFEIAEKFAHEPKPERSLAFIGWTMEEQGLLGSEYFANHPIVPLGQIVGGDNIDVMYPEGRAHDLVVVGSGASELEDLLTDVLKGQNRAISPDPEPEKGSFYRSDQLNLARKGVPMLYTGSGYDLVEGGKAAGQAVRDDYRSKRYHQPTDEYDASWDMTSAVDDLNALYEVGRRLVNSEAWPNWYQGNEFRAIRDQSRAGQ